MMDAHPSPEDTESILLVDNNPTHLHVLWQTLCGRGLQLLMAPSGEEALAIARKAHPALILLDIMLPGIDGFETCRQLKADPYAFYCEKPPKSASIVANLDKYTWGDQGWMEARSHKDWLREPISTYEVHAESWFRGPHGEPLTYREMAETLTGR